MPGKSPKSPGLFSNFVEYFNDNVCMMAMAASIGTLAAGLSTQALGSEVGPVGQAQAQMVICFCMICLLRLLGLGLQRATKAGSTMHDVYGAMLGGLPWFLRVPMVTLLPAYLTAMYEAVGWFPADTNRGKACVAFTLNMLVFVGMFSVLISLGWALRKLPDASTENASWPTFFVQSFYLAFLSGTGKSMHYAVRVVLLTLVGPISAKTIDLNQSLEVMVCIGMMTALAACLLSSSIPNQMTNPQLEGRPCTQIHLTAQQYVVVYTWAYAAVNFGWDVIYDFLGGSLTTPGFGYFLFICWLCVCLAAACMLAAGTPDKNFYDMGKGNSNKQAACLMTYWLVDFITWWAQGQMVTVLDATGEDFGARGQEGVRTESSWPIIGLNFAIVVSALFIIGGLHACNRRALLYKVAQGAGIKAQVMLRMAHRHHSDDDASEEEDDDESKSKDDDDSDEDSE